MKKTLASSPQVVDSVHCDGTEDLDTAVLNESIQAIGRNKHIYASAFLYLGTIVSMIGYFWILAQEEAYSESGLWIYAVLSVIVLFTLIGNKFATLVNRKHHREIEHFIETNPRLWKSFPNLESFSDFMEFVRRIQSDISLQNPKEHHHKQPTT
jgi:hypothetical protein